MMNPQKPPRARAILAVPEGQKCTWKDCGCKARFTQVNKEGKIWAFLCWSHRMALQMASRAGGRTLLRSWALAQGGSEVVAKRVEDIQAKANETAVTEPAPAGDSVAE